MFQFALAHSDLLGATYLYGHADPIDEIKGVSKYGYKAELMALIEIYKKLGCDFKKISYDEYTDKDTRKFEQTWEKGDKYNSANKNIQKLATAVVEHEKSQHYTI